MVKGGVWRLWAWLSSIVEFAAVAVVNHQQQVNFPSSDTRAGRSRLPDAAHVTPMKSREQIYLR
jgi:hypothetical protein